MNAMFANMQALTRLDLKDKFNTSKVMDMSEMFINMPYLTHIEYGKKFIHNSEADITKMFEYTNQVNKPNADTHSSWKEIFE